ncbi:hypothetical protein LTR08_007600 [Meristemomyces frigidus]|nr:hypothetical protein LTR08_007600 [Meristemomyces frigidus]
MGAPFAGRCSTSWRDVSGAARQMAPNALASTLTPFLYPCLLDRSFPIITRKQLRTFRHVAQPSRPRRRLALPVHTRRQTTSAEAAADAPAVDVNQYDHLTPEPPDFSSASFTDACTLTLAAGAGGHGCISFLREKYISHGPPNGGDGGTGGSVYIQAVRGETSLHKLARRGILKAGRGKNGQGSLRGGSRGEDILVVVPVGTVVREISRHDPLVEEDAAARRAKGFGSDADEHDIDPDAEGADQTRQWRRDKWLLFPGILPKAFTTADFPPLPRPRRSNLAATEPPGPIRLDLSQPMAQPLLLASGATGGLGNPHFVTKTLHKPKFATKGEDATRIHLQLELKLLADVGLVGLPNAGKSTLLRALTNSRTRVGSWAFTTLAPSVGTVVLDNHTGRPALAAPDPVTGMRKAGRTNFTIADIPGLIEDAHLDRGLGLGFLRHIERAAVLAFVVDLAAGDAVAALRGLWREVGEYEQLRKREVAAETRRAGGDETEEEDGAEGDQGGMVAYTPYENPPAFDPEDPSSTHMVLPPLALPPISGKPWLVIATKADLPATQDNFAALQCYLREVQEGRQPHPSGKVGAWRRRLEAVPVCAMKREGVSGIAGVILGLLDG